MNDAKTSADLLPKLLKVAESSRKPSRRKSRMVEISLSGSGGGSGGQLPRATRPLAHASRDPRAGPSVAPNFPTSCS
jgi:hypothetical protein